MPAWFSNALSAVADFVQTMYTYYFGEHTLLGIALIVAIVALCVGGRFAKTVALGLAYAAYLNTADGRWFGIDLALDSPNGQFNRLLIAVLVYAVLLLPIPRRFAFWRRHSSRFSDAGSDGSSRSAKGETGGMSGGYLEPGWQSKAKDAVKRRQLFRSRKGVAVIPSAFTHGPRRQASIDAATEREFAQQNGISAITSEEEAIARANAKLKRR